MERKRDFEGKGIKDVFEWSGESEMRLLKEVEGMIGEIE